jgi:hypothetical protein
MKKVTTTTGRGIGKLRDGQLTIGLDVGERIAGPERSAAPRRSEARNEVSTRAAGGLAMEKLTSAMLVARKKD